MPRDHCGNFLGAQLGSKEEHPEISIVAKYVPRALDTCRRKWKELKKWSLYYTYLFYVGYAAAFLYECIELGRSWGEGGGKSKKIPKFRGDQTPTQVLRGECLPPPSPRI